jgi:hypothetical protein
MKRILAVAVLFLSLASKGQSLQTYEYGKHTLTGKVILKTLTHPVTGKPIKNAMVLELTKPVKFAPPLTDKDDDTAITKEIRIYGDVTKNVDPNVTYKKLIGKKVAVTANYVFAPSGNYPLLVNIIEDFSYRIIE